MSTMGRQVNIYNTLLYFTFIYNTFCQNRCPHRLLEVTHRELSYGISKSLQKISGLALEVQGEVRQIRAHGVVEERVRDSEHFSGGNYILPFSDAEKSQKHYLELDFRPRPGTMIDLFILVSPHLFSPQSEAGFLPELTAVLVQLARVLHRSRGSLPLGHQGSRWLPLLPGVYEGAGI